MRKLSKIVYFNNFSASKSNKTVREELFKILNSDNYAN